MTNAPPHGSGTGICAVIVSYNAPESVVSCVESLSGRVDQIVVIDNGSGPAVRDFLGSVAFTDRVVFIFNEENRGLSAALNQGLRKSLESGYEWTLLLDQDSRASDEMIPAMLESYRNLQGELKEKTAVVVPAVLDINFNKMLPSVVTTNFLNRKIKEPDKDVFVHLHITSGSMIRNSELPKTGFMNEKLFIDYIDYEYCFRVLDSGYKILLSRRALLYHSLADHRRKFGFRFREHAAPRVYYQTRNRLFAMRAYGGRYRSFLFAEACRAIGKIFKIIVLESAKKEKIKMYVKGVRDFITGHKELASRG